LRIRPRFWPLCQRKMADSRAPLHMGDDPKQEGHMAIYSGQRKFRAAGGVAAVGWCN
jgi:hypothetical protein